MAPRSHHSKPQTQQVKDSDAAANEALLAHAEFTRSARSWLSGALGGYQGDGGDHGDDNQTSREEAGQSPKKDDGLNSLSLRPAGEEFNSDMNGLGYIPPKDSSGRPLATTSADATTAFLRKQLLGRTRPQRPADRVSGASIRGKPNGDTSHIGQRSRGGAAVKKDDSDEEDSRSRRGKVKHTPRKRAKATSTPEPDGDMPIGATNHPDGAISQSQVDSLPDSVGPLDANDRTSPLPTRQPPKRPASYLDQVLAERERKKNKKKKK